MYVCCLPAFTIALDFGGADCTRNGKVTSLLTHLKHRVSISVFLKALVVSITSTPGGTRHGTT